MCASCTSSCFCVRIMHGLGQAIGIGGGSHPETVDNLDVPGPLRIALMPSSVPNVGGTYILRERMALPSQVGSQPPFCMSQLSQLACVT